MRIAGASLLAMHDPKGLCWLRCTDRFAGKMSHIQDRFENVQTETLIIPAPLIKGGMAYFNCVVKTALPIGENTLFIAEVIAARGEASPVSTCDRLAVTTPMSGVAVGLERR